IMNFGGLSDNSDFFLSMRRWASLRDATRGACAVLSDDSAKRKNRSDPPPRVRIRVYRDSGLSRGAFARQGKARPCVGRFDWRTTMFSNGYRNLLLRWVQEAPGGLSLGEGESTVEGRVRRGQVQRR